MKTIIHSKRGGTALIIGGLLVWLTAIDSFLVDEPLGGVIVHGIGALVLLIIASFIPERSERQFVSRQSVLAGMGLLVYMSLSSIPTVPTFTWTLYSIWWLLALFLARIVLAWGSYRLALFAFRFFQQDRAAQHQAEQQDIPPNP